MMNRKQTRGVALIMALSVMLLLSVALMKTFENRSVETVHLANTLHQFQSETVSRSVLRAVLLTIQSKGLLFVLRNKEQWQDVPIFLNEGQYFRIKSIRSIDHLFNLNRRFRADDPSLDLFRNIVNQKLNDDDRLWETNEKTTDDITSILGAINDWIDADDLPDTEFLYNYEAYYDLSPEYRVKNRAFDFLSEVNLIPPFQETGFTAQELRDSFRIYAIEKDSNKLSIDINVCSVEEAASFLELLVDIPEYANLYDYRGTIVDILEERDAELEGEGKGPGSLEPGPRFMPLYDRKNSDWEQRLTSAAIKLNESEKALFSDRTHLLHIKLSVTTQRVTVPAQAIVEVEYISENRLDIKGFKILEFDMQAL
mgnify:CR=1 FL=1